MLAGSTQEPTGSEAKHRYGSRFTCEDSFRAIKDLRHGLSEDVGLDRLLKTNASNRRMRSSFRQELRWYELLPNMPTQRLRQLMRAFDARVRSHLVVGLLVRVEGE